MQRSKLLLIGAILEIVAGVLWLMNALSIMALAINLGKGVFLCILQLLLAVAITFSGVLFCAGKDFIRKKSKEINIIINVAAEGFCVIVQFLILCFANLQTLEALLAIGVTGIQTAVLIVSLFFFFMVILDHLQTKANDTSKDSKVQKKEISKNN